MKATHSLPTDATYTDPFNSIITTADPLFSSMRDIDLTVMTLVCKDFRNIIRAKFSARVVKKSEICAHHDMTRPLFDYMLDINCPSIPKDLLRFGHFDEYDKSGYKYICEYTEAAARFGRFDKLQLAKYKSENTSRLFPDNLLNHAIRGGQLGMAIELIYNGHKPNGGHAALALQYCPEIFDYFMSKSYKFNESDTEAEIIVNTCNYAAIDTLIRNKISLKPYIRCAIDTYCYPMIHYMEKVCQDDLKSQLIIDDNADIFKYINKIKKWITYQDIHAAINQESVNILKYTYINYYNLRPAIITLIINKDSLKLLNIFDAKLITNDQYMIALNKRAKNILRVAGYRKEFAERIIETNNTEILNIFPEVAASELLMYAILNKLEIAAEWIIGKGIMLTEVQYKNAMLMDLLKITKPHKK